MNTRKRFFEVEVIASDGRCFFVCRPSSLDNPYDNSVMFIREKFIEKWKVFLKVQDCLIYWPETFPIPAELLVHHVVVPCNEPRLAFCCFFRDHHITGQPEPAPFKMVDGAYICEGATIGERVTIMPGAYIGPEVVIGNDCYIGAGSKLVGRVICGNNIIIQENVVIGARSRTTDRDDSGRIVTMPQFGGVIIGDDVEIGPNSIIHKGAIDDSILESGCKIDSLVSFGHNSTLGKDSIMIAGTVFHGSVHAGERTLFAGNVIVRNQTSIGSDTIVGIGSVVTKSIPSGVVVMGNPARIKGD